MASLVWSVNTGLSASQVRQILQSTALDIGATGRDNTFGSGVVDTGRAVRRAVALARDPNLANLAPVPFNGQVTQADVAGSKFAQLTTSRRLAPSSSPDDNLVGGGTVSTPPGDQLVGQSQCSSKDIVRSAALDQVLSEQANDGSDGIGSIGTTHQQGEVTPLFLSDIAEDQVLENEDYDLLGLDVEDLALELACLQS